MKTIEFWYCFTCEESVKRPGIADEMEYSSCYLQPDHDVQHLKADEYRVVDA